MKYDGYVSMKFWHAAAITSIKDVTDEFKISENDIHADFGVRRVFGMTGQGYEVYITSDVADKIEEQQPKNVTHLRGRPFLRKG